ncbi:hypothetical protein [Streptomyces flaveus]|uniref:Uncharacterized protein n=1 Tax=Streptomyces flaveus TaxID=66370 RepID=A0A917V7A4_9ACTN|nr:hypothetical protein [Streptomyces flaveus]GGK46073.1 hypothetical protein GCM10010094_02450 [Streptomyces flaveus]
MAEYEGEGDARTDALLAAITDEPLPQEALDDPEFMAEHRSAMADVAELREQLLFMGEALAAESERSQADPAPVRTAKPPRRAARSWQPRRYAGLALGALVVATGTTLLGGLVWLGVQSGGGADAGTSSADSGAGRAETGSGDDTAADGKDMYSPEMHIACSKVLVEGTVQSITPAADGNVRVALKVKRYYRPEQSVTDHPTITVTLLASARQDLKVGTYTLVRVPVYPQDRQDWETGWGVGDARKGILDALPGAQGLKCPAPQQNGG